MHDEPLRQFVSRFGSFVVIGNDLRIALKSGDEKRIKHFAEAFIAAARSVDSDLISFANFKEHDDEWRFQFAAWGYGGNLGTEPPRPDWPENIPQFEDCLESLNNVTKILRYANQIFGGDFRVLPYEVGYCLACLIQRLDCLRGIMQDPDEDDPDGPIDRNELAALLNVKPKTLANRASELPAPIGRDAKNVPIYSYLTAKRALIDMFPDKAFMLGSYKEAKTRESI